MQTALPRIRKAQFFSMIRMYETSAANQRAAVRADMDGSGKLTLFDRIEESLEIHGKKKGEPCVYINEQARETDMQRNKKPPDHADGLMH